MKSSTVKYTKLLQKFKFFYLKTFKVIGGTIYFTDIPQRKALHGITGEALTKINFDKSQILKELIKLEYENGILLDNKEKQKKNDSNK